MSTNDRFHEWLEQHRPEGLVLDVGCGTHKHGDIGIDITRAGDICADAEALPFKDDTFDGAICAQVLSYTTGDPIAIVREILRVMRPGGVALYTFPRWRPWPNFRPASLGARKVQSVRGLFSYTGYEVTK